MSQNECRVQCQNKDCKKIFDEYQNTVCPYCGQCPKCSYKQPRSPYELRGK